MNNAIREMEKRRESEHQEMVLFEELKKLNPDSPRFFIPSLSPAYDEKSYESATNKRKPKKRDISARRIKPESMGLSLSPENYRLTKTNESDTNEQQPTKPDIHDRNITPKSTVLYQSPMDEKKNNGLATTTRGSYQEFSNDLLSILNDTSSSDVTIKNGTEDLKVHKIILSARSPVFKAMFRNNMRESAEGTVLTDDIEPEIVRDMLFFIYSNQVNNLSVPKACDLLDAAEKYQLQSLKRVCVDFLMSNLSLANAFIILQKADLYDKNLKLHTMKFIRDKFSDLKSTEEWKTVQTRNPTLALEVLNMVVEQFT